MLGILTFESAYKTAKHVPSYSIRSLTRHRPDLISKYNKIEGKTLEATPAAAIQRKRTGGTLAPRTGALATKYGMTALYDPDTGVRTPATVLQLDRVQVVGHKTFEKHGYDAVVLGEGWRSPRNVGSAMRGVFAGAKHESPMTGGIVGVSPKRTVREFEVDGQVEGCHPAVGTLIGANWFQTGQFVDVQAKTKGKGFTGVMKRWGMHGQPASHGVSLTHRSLGSAGGGQGSGSRVHPGKKMAGRMGGETHTVQNLKVLQVDAANGILVVNGAVCGPKKGLVKIRDSKKKPWPDVNRGPPAGQEAAQPA
ncbi:MAG: 54S ribosomal protein L9, mitochondrial [Chrysothrix sp. TS-e1954]|nr:MAG: 54S ribosomal protein L9, mitochondrial [Chrysothrix sp. TS-e1954]